MIDPRSPFLRPGPQVDEHNFTILSPAVMAQLARIERTLGCAPTEAAVSLHETMVDANGILTVYSLDSMAGKRVRVTIEEVAE